MVIPSAFRNQSPVRERMGETGIVNARNGRHLSSWEHSHGRTALTRTSKAKQLRVHIIKSGWGVGSGFAVHVYRCMCGQMCVRIRVCVYVCMLCMCAGVYMYRCMCRCVEDICVHRGACIDVHVCACIGMCVHTGIYTHTCASMEKRWDETTRYRPERAPTPGCLGNSAKGHNAEQGLGAERRGLAAGLCRSAASSGTQHFSSSTLRMGPCQNWCETWVTKETWERFRNPREHIQALLPVSPNAEESDFLSQQASQESLTLSQAAISKGRRDTDHIPKMRCFLILYYFQNKKAESPPFCFSK